jgi:hypothetical protein
MAYSIEVRETITAGGKSASSRSAVSGDGSVAKEVSVPAAKVGQLTTRTDDNTGVITMTSGHGFATSDKLDVYWSGGRRLGMTATVATNAVTVDGGSGDNLPANLAAVTAMKPVEEPVVFDGDDVLGIEMYSDVAGTLSIVDDEDAVSLSKQIGGGTAQSERSYIWMPSRDPVNPLAAVDIAKFRFSHGDSTKAALMRIYFVTT